MKKIIPFSKEIAFQTTISEITDIEVTHNLEVGDNNTIEGYFLVRGTYKMSASSEVEEKFEESLPFIIEVDEKYDLENVNIRINDFYFEIINEDILKVNIELELSGMEEKIIEEEEAELLERCYDEEEEEEDKDMLEEQVQDFGVAVEGDEKWMPHTDIIEPLDILDETPPVAVAKVTQPVSKSISAMFPTVSEEEDTFKSYYVYIVRENDTIDDILNRYQATREEVGEYNNLEEVKIGTKLIIPSASRNDE